MSKDVFQLWMDQATDHLPGIITIHASMAIPLQSMTDTCCSWCRQPKNTALSSAALWCWIRQPRIPSWWPVLTAQGLKQDPTKIQALQVLPTPHSWAKLQSFLGLINYLQAYQQNYVLAWTASQVGLKPINRCSLPLPQSLDLPDPAQCSPHILWQIWDCHSENRY